MGTGERRVHGSTLSTFHVNPFSGVSRNGTPEPYRAWKDVVLVPERGRPCPDPHSLSNDFHRTHRLTTAISLITRKLGNDGKTLEIAA